MLGTTQKVIVSVRHSGKHMKLVENEHRIVRFAPDRVLNLCIYLSQRLMFLVISEVWVALQPKDWHFTHPSFSPRRKSTSVVRDLMMSDPGS